MKRLVALLALLMLLTVGSVTAQSTPSGTITLYTSESESDVNTLITRFNEIYPDITVNVFRSGSGEVVARLQAEREAGAIQADLLWFADIDYINILAEDDLLLEFVPNLPAGLDEEGVAAAEEALQAFRYLDNRAFEVRLIFNVVAYNTTLVSDIPTSWKDLLRPELNGMVGMPSALYSGAAFNQVGTFINLEDFGWEFYEALRDNNVVVERGNGGVSTKLANGEFAMAQIVDFFVRRAAQNGSPVAHIWPEEGALLVPTPITIMKDSQNVDAAKAFVDFLFTPEAQNTFVELGYIPLMPGTELPAGTPDMADLVIIQPDLENIRANRELIRTRFTELFGTSE
ncbi:MAG: ABC transporter substrate-binding protein [Anaerolineae bacterium]